MVYISKPGEWFKAGTVCILIDDYRPGMDAGLFKGIRVCENPGAEAETLGVEYMDEEICSFDEFDIIDGDVP